MHTRNNFEYHVIVIHILLILLHKCVHHISSAKQCDERVSSEKEHLFISLGILWVKKAHKDNDDSVICHLCRTVMLAQGGNTSNLFSHLKIHHAKECASKKRERKRKHRQGTRKAVTTVGNR